MSDITENLNKKLKAHEEWFEKELAILRIGRANPALIEDIAVEYYGSKIPLKQLAAISTPEPRTLIVQPWDKNSLSAIEKAIQTSSLGINPVVDRDIIRISIPPLTEERRLSLVKIVKTKLEEVKISVRKTRDEANKEIDDLFGNKKITEDEKFKKKQDFQKAVDETNKSFQNLAERKEKEIKEL